MNYLLVSCNKLYKVLVKNMVNFPLSFLTLNFGRPKEFHMPFYLIRSFQDRVKYFQKSFNVGFKFPRYMDYSNLVLNWRVKIYWTGRRNVVFLRKNMFVQPDIDYFVVFTIWLLHRKKNGANGRIGRDKLISKLKRVINHQNWALLGTMTGFWLIRVFLVLCNWSECTILLSSNREKMKWQAKTGCRSNSIGYKIKHI